MNTDSNESIMLYFLLLTSFIWLALYAVMSYFGNTLADIPSNGNVIIPLFNDILSWFIAFLNSISLSLFSDFFAGLYTQISTFMNIWNVLNIYLFYVIFIPFVLVLIIYFIKLVYPVFIGD